MTDGLAIRRIGASWRRIVAAASTPAAHHRSSDAAKPINAPSAEASPSVLTGAACESCWRNRMEHRILRSACWPLEWLRGELTRWQ